MLQERGPSLKQGQGRLDLGCFPYSSSSRGPWGSTSLAGAPWPTLHCLAYFPGRAGGLSSRVPAMGGLRSWEKGKNNARCPAPSPEMCNGRSPRLRPQHSLPRDRVEGQAAGSVALPWPAPELWLSARGEGHSGLGKILY